MLCILLVANPVPILYFGNNKEKKGKLMQPLWRMVRRFVKKIKIELPYDPAIPLLGIYLEKTLIQKIHGPQCS